MCAVICNNAYTVKRTVNNCVLSVKQKLFNAFVLSSSRTRVCPPFLSSISGGDPTEEPVSVARRTLPASRLRTPPPHSDSGTVPEPADPPPCSPLPPPPLPAKTADPLQHLYSTAGQVMCECVLLWCTMYYYTILVYY